MRDVLSRSAGSVNLFRPVAKGRQDNAVFEITGGRGIANSFNDTSGPGLDGFVQPSNVMSALSGAGSLPTSISGPEVGVDRGVQLLHVYDLPTEAPTTYESGNYVVANLRWYAIDRVWIGVELLYGIRRTSTAAPGTVPVSRFRQQYRF